MREMRPRSDRTSRLASIGLAVVVACLAGFSIVTAYAAETHIDRAERAEMLHDSYGGATMAIRAEETLELEYLAEPSAQVRSELMDAKVALVDAVNKIASQGGAHAELASDILSLHGRYLSASARLLAAMDAGDFAAARLIEWTETDLIFSAMRDRISSETRAREAEADEAFAVLHDTARWMLIASPIVFAIGFAFLLGLWRILERYQQETYETYRQIEQVGRQRSEFVSIVSHEFRTPLTGIQGFSEIMLEEDLPAEQVREFAGDINKDARRLGRLITDMLDLDRMESGRMTMRLENLDFNKLVTDAVTQFRPNAAGHQLELRLDGEPMMLSADADRMAQVVTNLVSNAVKYSPNGDGIEIATKRSGDIAQLEVRDHGLGIPADQIEKIFERYSRVDSAETRGIQGTGLGLPIVRQIAQMHGGRVWATSQPGVGSTFHVELPIHAAANAARASVTVSPV